MLNTALEVIFKGVGYSLIVYAFWLLIGNSFYDYYIKNSLRKYQAKKRIRRLKELQNEVVESHKTSLIKTHLETLLASVSKTGHSNVSNFIMISIILWVITTLLLQLTIGDPTFALIIGTFIGASPYLILRYRLESLRLRTSLAFMNEFHVILQSYQSTSQQNIYHTLLKTVEDLTDKDMARLFRKIISSIQKDRNTEGYKKQVHLFIYSINSTYAKRFGNLLLKAHEDADIKQSLTDLADDITQRKKDMEVEATNKMETVLVGFAPIVVLPLILFFAYQVTGVIDFWHYFIKPSSLTLFIITVIISVLSVVFATLIRRPRADI